ncbi:MAG: toll/interleukin-1 receptor domain-containing protein [Pyrinomonadaceae bacterium]
MPEVLTSYVPIEVFISYSHKDGRLYDRLVTNLASLKREGVITDWHDRMIPPGNEWAKDIDEHLNKAKIILLLVSADFIASDYCYDVEVKRAMERHEAGEASVIPVILRPCHWQVALFAKLQALPVGARPVTKWPNQAEAFLSIVKGIRKAVNEIDKRKDITPNNQIKLSIQISVQITIVPPRWAGSDALERIAGTVGGVQAQEYKVVIFAHTDKWYVQPYIGLSDTPIKDDGTWENNTHLGFEYAALLVRTSYNPPDTTGTLPNVAGSVLAITRVAARQ